MPSRENSRDSADGHVRKRKVGDKLNEINSDADVTTNRNDDIAEGQPRNDDVMGGSSSASYWPKIARTVQWVHGALGKIQNSYYNLWGVLSGYTGLWVRFRIHIYRWHYY
jgi:hypothetical protein